MYKFYTKYDFDSVVNVFEFKPSDTLVPVVSVGSTSTRQPLVDIRHNWMENQGYNRLAGINLSFFNMGTMSPQVIGVDYRDEGFTFKSPDDTTFRAFELAYKDKELIIGDMNETFFNTTIENKADWAVSLSYSLVIDGRINIKCTEGFDHYRYRHPRSLIGQKRDGTIVLCVVDGRSQKSRGVTAQQSAEIMLSLGCVKAINADGGGSSQLMYMDKMVNDYPGLYARPISNALLVYDKLPIKKEEPEEYPTLKLWAKGDYVLILQRLLEMFGCDPGKADGIFGPKVFSAVKQYQKKEKMFVSGAVHREMWVKLLKS
jgi:hypothetical protein